MKIRIVLTFMIMAQASCVQEMAIVGRLYPLGAIDGKPVARPLPKNTIAQGQLLLNSDNNHSPAPLSKAMLERGRERYDIYCAACHGLSGFGDGVIVERGFSPPPSFHQERLREAPPLYFSNIIKNGFGTMYGYSDLISPTDAWAIVGYIRALQLSQYVHLEKLPANWRKNILRAIK